MARKGVNDGSNGGSLPVPGFDFGQMLSIADALPMAIAYVDRDLRYVSSTSRWPISSASAGRTWSGGRWTKCWRPR